MDTRASSEFGVPFVDATAKENGQTDLGADQFNRLGVDVAQGTHTLNKAIVTFACVAAGNPTNTTHKSQWGDGAGQLPTVTRTGAGRYSVQYAATFTDELSEVETLSFFGSVAEGWTANASDNIDVRKVAISARQIDLVVQSPAGTPADVGNISGSAINVDLFIR
jgi:hypothetical protein